MIVKWVRYSGVWVGDPYNEHIMSEEAQVEMEGVVQQYVVRYENQVCAVIVSGNSAHVVPVDELIYL